MSKTHTEHSDMDHTVLLADYTIPAFVSRADPQCTFMCQISSRSVYSVALWWRKTPIFAVFVLWHLVVSRIFMVVTSMQKMDQNTAM